MAIRIAPHRRALAALLALTLAAVACSANPLEVAPDTQPTTSTEPPTSVATDPTPLPPTELPPAEFPTFADDGEAIAVDDEVRRGQLDNGLSYYVRSNDNPGSRAQLRLVVDAGSAMEADDQIGGAHFLEHMLFNGTEQYPANELISVLESFGFTFGPDINAYTTFGETVYMLEVPTDDPALLDTAFGVLREWADNATLDPEQVELERGVVLAEWRRGQGFWSRYRNEVLDRLLGTTGYANRMPIGTEESIETVTAEALRRFYEDWYRPELMSVVAVGDFDVGAIEDRITSTFADLTNPPGAPARPEFLVEPAAEPTFMSLSDPESSDTFVELNYPLPLLPHDTVGTVRRDLALDLAFLVLSTRLDEDTRRPNAAFYEASGAANPLVREQQSPGLFLYTDPGNAEQSLRDALTEIERGRRFGITQDELDRAITVFRNSVIEAYNARNSKQDAAYADEYVSHYLSASPIASARDTRDLYERLLDEMTVDQVNDTFRASIDSTQPLIIVASPEDGQGVIPTESQQAGILDDVRSGPVDQRDTAGRTIEVLLDPPDAAPVTRTERLGNLIGPQGTETAKSITFGNGVQVAMIDNQIVSGSVFFRATSPGGWSVEAAEDVVEAQLIPQVIVDSGVADFDQVALDRYLADKTVQVQPYIDELDEGFVGEASTDDLETLFQLMHLY
ncbi:MAG: insulinase family protein, partial [Acidimicrobiales bacterium]|nr:insulinase family protein [Acidimicrobiales bacterium]